MGTEVPLVVGRIELGRGECAPSAYQPVTINDLELNEKMVEIHRQAALLDHYSREGMEHRLFLALLTIHRSAEDAMDRLNKMRR